MERSEPTFVPQWLKGTTGNGNANHHSSHSDDHGVVLHSRNRLSLSFSDYDSSRSSVLTDRTSSTYFRRSSSSNGPMLFEKDISSNSRSYSSFNRNNRREKEKTMSMDHRDCDDISALTSRIEKDMLRRSNLMVSGNRGEMWPRTRVVPDSNNNSNHRNHNGVGVNNKRNIGKAVFERDFPHLGAEEKQEVLDRALSPSLPSPVQSFPMGNTSNGWASHLVLMPPIVGNNNPGVSSVPQPCSATVIPSVTAGLSMAETLAQAPSRARTAPQASTETQKLEELAIKQSRQLIPMTPSMPKNLVLVSEKQKPKAGSRNETNVANKIGQQQLPSSQLINHSLRGTPTKPDAVMTSHGGKLLVLKSPRDNGILPATKDSPMPTNSGRTGNQLSLAPSAANNPKLASAERKAPAPPTNINPSLEKKPTMSQARSRNDFFNEMRKKTSTNFTSAAPVTSSVTLSAVLDKSCELNTQVTPIAPEGNDSPVSDPPSSLDWSNSNGADISSNGDYHGESERFPNNGEKHSSSDANLYPDEEEAAFLRSLGWEENAGEEEGLTEEEINAFYQEYVNLRPSLMRQPRQSLLPDSHAGGFNCGSRTTSSSDSRSET